MALMLSAVEKCFICWNISIWAEYEIICIIKDSHEVIRFFCPYVGWETFAKLSPRTPKCKTAHTWLISILEGLTFAAYILILWTRTGVTFRITQGYRVSCDTGWLLLDELVECWAWPYSCRVWQEGNMVGGDSLWAGCLTLGALPSCSLRYLDKAFLLRSLLPHQGQEGLS